jgi:hypothetical protein
MTTDVFEPLGNTLELFAVNEPSEAAKVASGLQAPQYRIIHPGTELVWLGVGATAADAIANAKSGTGPGLPIMPGTDEVFEFGRKNYFAALSQNSTQAIYITPGLGM